ncbi:TMV resistance protein N [Quercus suber]|uniref:TMV resistance protein N n=1 Tax=Quercus suber TaxID=58331 RepID=UPI0032DFC35B
MWGVRGGIDVIGKRLHNRKVLIVLDDVDEKDQLDALARRHDWLGPGSRIIITSRDKHLLERSHMDMIYSAKGLEDDKTLELFSWTVFKKPRLEKDFVDLSKGEGENQVADILKDSGYYKDIEILKDKSLITISGRKLWMHDLLQEIGKEIVSREAPQEPGRCSRLWNDMDVFSILKNNTGMEFVEGMVINSSPHKEELNVEAFSKIKRLRLIKIYNVQLPQGLNYLSNELRMMDWCDYPLKSMPISFQLTNLVELIMPHNYIKQLPTGFANLDKLKLMDLSDSQHLINTPDFNGFPNLKRLIFQGCTRLYKIYPSIGALKRLTLLNLKDCKHLHSLPHEINIESLEIFILSGCSRLRNFLEIERDMTRLLELYLDGTAIEELPSSFKHLTGLILLNLQECENISSFPQFICSLTSLKILNLLGCNSQPPKSWHFLGLSFIYATLVLWKNSFFIAQHPELEPINLFMPRSFSGLRSLVSLDLSDCNLLDGAFLGDLGCLSSVQFLNLSKSNFTHLPDSISQLPKRTVLYMDNCSRLQALPNLPLSAQFVMARGCASLQNYNEVVVWTPGET